MHSLSLGKHSLWAPQPSVALFFHQASQLCTLYMQYSCCIWEWGFLVWSSKLKKKKNLANHWLSLVLMKGNNSLTCTKTVQKQPFLMSDTSCPRDAFHVSHSLIKQHPGEKDGGRVNFVCVRETTLEYVYVCVWERERLCVWGGEREVFGFWIVRCDLGTLIFTQASITLVVVLFTVLLLWQSAHFLLSKEVGCYFFPKDYFLSNSEY